MKVLLITGSFPPDRCGVGDYCFNLAKALSSLSKINVAVLANISSTNMEDSQGIQIFPLISGWKIVEALKVIRTIRHWSPDIVHIQYPTQGYQNRPLPWLLPLIAFLMGKRVVQTWHEGYRRRDAFKLFLKAIAPSGIVVVRQRYSEQLSPLLRWSLWGKKRIWIKSASSIRKTVLSEPELRQLRREYLHGQKRLIVFFGFVYPHKGIELLFEIADPATDQIVIAGEMDEKNPYCQRILSLASEGIWKGKATGKGFLPDKDIGALLRISDAVIFPFHNGVGDWNTSFHAAVLHGTFVLATSLTRRGYDTTQNVYYTQPNDLTEMRSALSIYAGKRRSPSPDIDDEDAWHQIAVKHQAFYEAL